jgi:nucleoside-diphosphate-sugar epimerase
MDVPAHVVHLPARHEVHHVHASHRRLSEVFGVRPATDLDAGLREMAAWVRRHGARRGAPFKNIEIARQLPASWVS